MYQVNTRAGSRVTKRPDRAVETVSATAWVHTILMYPFAQGDCVGQPIRCTHRAGVRLGPSPMQHDYAQGGDAPQNGQFPGLGSSMRLAAPLGTSEVT